MFLHVFRLIAVVVLLGLGGCGGGGGGQSVGKDNNLGVVDWPPLEIGLVISEVSSCYYLNADCWFEVHNTSSVSLQMNQFQLRSYAVDVVTKSVSLATFDLPAVLLAPDAYAIVSGNASNRAQISTQNMKVRQGNLIPIWQDSGLIELVKDGATVDFVSFGDLALLPLSAQAWNGANVPALPSSPTDHGRAIVRPYTSYGATNTRSAADWVSVDWVTPAGRNDVGPGVLDEDQDGIPDSAEVQGGTYAGLDLYAMGARTGTKNLFLEVDQMWSNDAGVVVQKAALQKVVDAFASHDIVVSFDAGSAFSSSFSTADFNLGQTHYRVPLEMCTTTDQSTCVRNSSTRRSIYDWKDEFMDLRRRAIFHYALFAVSQNVDGSCGSSGVGELLGNDFLVTLGGCGLSLSDSDRRNATINFQAATVMHELGHNLGLRHGGDEDTNYKPNYFSIMNYLYSLTGLDPDPRTASAFERWRREATSDTSSPCNLTASPCGTSFIIDYSSGSSTVLNEQTLNEADHMGRGTTGGAYADWDLNGSLTSGTIKVDLNQDQQYQSLHDYDDWSHLTLPFVREFSGNRNRSLVLTTPKPVMNPIGQDRQEVAIEHPGRFRLKAP